MRYSAPHRLAGRTVDVRLGASTVAVLDGGETVAEHPRLRGRRGQYSTGPAHMPPEHAEAQSLWTRAWFERRAGEIGPEAKGLIGSVLDAHPIEAQGYVPCPDILSLSKRGRAAELEGACVEDIYYLPDRSITRDRIARLATCAWIEARENLVIISESGGGKSCIAQALGVAACRKLMSVRYARLNDMFRELNVARSEGRVYDALDRFARPDLLILDDFFTTPIESPLNAVDLFEILEAREGRGSTMFASQLEPDQWYLRINSELCADSIPSRAVEHARVLDIKGPNMREYTASLKAESDKGYWD